MLGLGSGVQGFRVCDSGFSEGLRCVVDVGSCRGPSM